MLLGLGPTLGSSRFLFGHFLPAAIDFTPPKPGWHVLAPRHQMNMILPLSSPTTKNYPAIAQPDACIG
jgi:hypothetical protein